MEKSQSKMFPCGQCERIFNTYGAKYFHMQSVHKGLRYKRNICNMELSRANGLKNHLEGHNNPKPEKVRKKRTYPCQFCSRTYNNYSAFKYHVDSVHKDRGYQCIFCENVVTSVESLNGHIRGHIRELPFSCKTCGKSFVTNGTLRSHSVCHVLETEKAEECNVCGKRFADRKRLNIHIPTHTGEKYYKCEKCGKAFASTNHLKRHRAVHTDAKPYRCPKCNKKFGNSENLKTHLITHKKFSKKCPQCRKYFTNPISYKTHFKRMHPIGGVAIRPLTRVFCNKSFNLSGNLFRHIRAHIGEYYENCDLCELQFIDRSAMYAHMRYLHTKEKMFSCDVCGKGFVINREMKRHRLIHSGPQKSFH